MGCFKPKVVVGLIICHIGTKQMVGESLTLTLIQIATNNTRGENWNNTTPRLLKMPGSI
jgi:hypothetical protein